MDELFHAAPDAVTGGRILIVDDDPVVAGMLGISLVAAGHRVAEAYSGEEALAQLERLAGADGGQLPDVVILDIELGGGIDGYEACRRLRAPDATRDLPVIFLSGHDALDDRLRAYDAGAMMVGCELADGRELEPAIGRLFANPAAAYLHIHYAAPGCYAARVDRS